MDSSVCSIVQLRALVGLIGDAAQAIEKQLSTSKSTKELPADPELRASIYTIEAASAQLCNLVARPSDSLVNKFMAFFEPACLQVALSNRIPDILQGSSHGVHVSELGRRTGVDQAKLGRVLRLLATKHVFQEVSPDTFANNHLSSQLVSTDPLCSFGLHITDECFKAASVLSDTLNDPRLTASTAPHDSAFSKYFGIKGTLFDYYAGSSPDQVKRATRFGPSMIGWGAAIEADAVINDFPWDKLKKGSIVCDVGGGIGNISIQLAKRYPAIRLVLQDLPEQLGAAENKIWPERCPEAMIEKRVSFVPLDFFTESPKKRCDIYFVKNVLHDWSDGDCIKILKSVKIAMTIKSRLLIHEFIVQPAYRVPEAEANFTQAPEPLLPNYGDGRIRQYAMDINMMTLLNSRERTLEDFIQLGDAAGLQFVKLWETAEMGLVEFVLQDEQVVTSM
ncbi:S-adenosyl-L-methionine-dependent methyltransferase [Macrolepiota fuliginosa MF-IS2]|uniref:S-adenosyl-L-methionine-dependent methyltransferase n=1 Tax=Macrolepiota fuliginosa MF-IS2 TaxID=1400762 RepID=A0A9P5XNC7_9AGAR|nr:S-adenosyl-L-methionine-dependent methyltransferase [Macrolepiota fuliginosa MF-IS2]